MKSKVTADEDVYYAQHVDIASPLPLSQRSSCAGYLWYCSELEVRTCCSVHFAENQRIPLEFSERAL
jgi:hypothetical protein